MGSKNQPLSCTFEEHQEAFNYGAISTAPYESFVKYLPTEMRKLIRWIKWMNVSLTSKENLE